MKKEFESLSEKRIFSIGTMDKWRYREEDVKEAVKRLKEDLEEYFVNHEDTLNYNILIQLCRIIDKRFGDKLTC